MTLLAIPQSKMSLRATHFNKEKPSQAFYEVSEGMVIAMDQQQLDQAKALIGDGLASVTISSEMSESDYGTGLRVFCSVKLTCDQSAAGIQAAGQYAASASDYLVQAHFYSFRDQLIKQGLIKPPKGGQMFGPTP